MKARKKITKLLAKNFTVFDFDGDSAEIKSFIKHNFIPGRASIKSPITKNNFPHIYNRWVTEVKPTINISADRWQKYKREGVLDLDFFLADIMSRDGKTITEKLNIIRGCSKTSVFGTATYENRSFAAHRAKNCKSLLQNNRF